MTDHPAFQDAFCAVALLLGVPAGELEAALGSVAPPWVQKYQASPGSQGRATQLAPRLLAIRLAADRGRVSWA